MSDTTIYVVTDDAAMLSGDPKRLHPTDLMLLAGKKAISMKEAMRQIEQETEAGEVDDAGELPPDMARVDVRVMAQLADDKMKDFLFVAHYLMCPNRAEAIRELRVDRGQSWRAIASETYSDCEHLPGFAQTVRKVWWPPANQLMGMALCEVAATTFGEDYLATPWN